ncbi:XdhC family protein [Conexibacter sp. CPCC 206217]|uniref:XdhC family protein n=1 Tax=Conexibacter sp. CPCC 206217 TaxID=3064574 RepID=UPI00271B246C|nr:XdhC/CoxI family protein [Conexibacter sp. CPCC 206217]MDO8209065.1 XdhC family protein [Conexibacter sp. CPCC 206217]
MSVVGDQAGVVGGWLAGGRRAARAVLVAVEGSAPLSLGASMFVGEDGAVEGSITGGCVESAVVQEAYAVLAGGPPRIHTYGISDELAGTAGLTCGGTVHVFVHALDDGGAAAVAAAYAAVREGRPAAVATLLDGPGAGAAVAVVGGREGLVGSLGVTPLLDHSVGRDAAGLLEQGVTAIRRYGVDGATLGAELRVHVRSFASPPRMLIFGAIDFSAALAPLAKELGYAVTISDPRAVFVRASRFARAAEVHVGWPDAAFAGRSFGPRDVILVFSHDPRLDVPALEGALATGAGYIGALGSRRTTDERNERLRGVGVGEEQIARIFAPCGLDIGGRTPEETAVSILAEIVTTRAGRPAAPLRDTSGSIQPHDTT